MIDISQTFQVSKSNYKAIGGILICVFFVVAGVWLITDNSNSIYQTISHYIGWATCLVFGILTLTNVLVFVSTPATPILITSYGIHDKRMYLNTIYWMNLSSISVEKNWQGGILRLKLTETGHDSLQTVARCKVFGWLHSSNDPSTISLPLWHLNISHDELVAIIKEYAGVNNARLFSNDRL